MDGHVFFKRASRATIEKVEGLFQIYFGRFIKNVINLDSLKLSSVRQKMRQIDHSG